jgi:hypothetical protein
MDVPPRLVRPTVSSERIATRSRLEGGPPATGGSVDPNLAKPLGSRRPIPRGNGVLKLANRLYRSS